MTVALAMPIQEAVYDALRAALPAEVPIFDHVRSDTPELFVRIDGWGVVDASSKNCEHGRHTCYVRVFHRPSGLSTHPAGQRTIKEIQVLAVAALHRLKPVAGDGAEIWHRESTVDTSDDGLTGDGLSRFQITI